ncbi:MAG: NfeD family protein [Thermoleophilia bacterium]|nr:NfeD family protein [Thermoleophilia bacterium]
MPDWSWWMIVAVVFALGELAVFTGFILGPLAIAAAVAAAAAASGAGIEVQLIVFGVFSAVTITLLRPIAKRHMNSPPEILTNAPALIGKRAIVLEAMTDEAPGLIRLENENWTARPATGISRIEAESRVVVKQIAGATAIVEPLNKSDEDKSAEGDVQ